jgi:DNA (cytosine-5)-methyltransferase 1
MTRNPAVPPMGGNISLCTGSGALDLAVEAVTGLPTVMVGEKDPAASRLLAARLPRARNLGDITAVDFAALAAELARPAALTAGFPCQDISNAGPRGGIAGDRSGLWKTIALAIRHLRPRLGFLACVAAIRSRGLDTVAADLAACGYDARWMCLRAGDPEVGACHRRDRWFALAYPAAEDPHLPVGTQRGTAAPGQAQSRGSRAHAGGRSGLLAAPDGRMRLLPTPKASDGPHGGPNQRDRAGHYYLPGQAVRLDGRWVATNGTDYGPASRRWETVLGRPAPEPTEPGTKGNRRLSPAFVEWMMGADPGWVTGTDLGLSRSDQLTILGNGVVIHQAALAYRTLLATLAPEAAEPAPAQLALDIA